MRVWTVVFAAIAALHATAASANDPARVVFPESVQQGAMVIGKVPPGSEVDYAGRRLRVTPYGSVVLGIGRDAAEPAVVSVRRRLRNRFRNAILVLVLK